MIEEDLRLSGWVAVKLLTGVRAFGDPQQGYKASRTALVGSGSVRDRTAERAAARKCDQLRVIHHRRTSIPGPGRRRSAAGRDNIADYRRFLKGASSAAGDGGDDRHGLALCDGRVEPFEEPHVLVRHEYVDESTEIAPLVEQPWLHPRDALARLPR